ncbi:MAG: DUF1491 family protein [Rhodospirillales bacterium]|nr:DUF1491 family protein [Rhodospirillales bacterium]
MADNRLPTELWLDAQLRMLNGRGIFYYIQRRGERNSGLVLLKLNGLAGQCRLLAQERDWDTEEMGWTNALPQDLVEERAADAYIARAVDRDPDLWVIEIEDREMNNPLEGKEV